MEQQGSRSKSVLTVLEGCGSLVIPSQFLCIALNSDRQIVEGFRDTSTVLDKAVVEIHQSKNSCSFLHDSGRGNSWIAFTLASSGCCLLGVLEIVDFHT